MISFFSKKGLKVEEVVGSCNNSYFLCEGGELFGTGRTEYLLPILISKDVERVFSGPNARHAFFTKLDGSVWSFGWNHNNQRGFVGNELEDRGIRIHNDLASNEIVKIACGFANTH